MANQLLKIRRKKKGEKDQAIQQQNIQMQAQANTQAAQAAAQALKTHAKDLDSYTIVEESLKDIEQKCKPQKGAFCIFSSFLSHGCKKNTDTISKFGMSLNFNKLREF